MPVTIFSYQQCPGKPAVWGLLRLFLRKFGTQFPVGTRHSYVTPDRLTYHLVSVDLGPSRPGMRLDPCQQVADMDAHIVVFEGPVPCMFAVYSG